MHPLKRALRLYCWLAFAGVAASVLINVAVDPYDIFHFVYNRSFNVHKIDDLDSHSRVTKSMKVIRYKPQRILLGSSIVDSGFLLPGAIAVSYGHPSALLEKLPPEERPLYMNVGIRG